MNPTRKKLSGNATRLADTPEKVEDHPPMQKDDHDGGFFYVDLSLISIDPTQPRKHFDPDSLSNLCESIKSKGVLQPVIIRKDADDRIWLVAGERRYKAASMAGLDRIPAILTTGNPHEIALIENLQREDLKPIEEAEALERLAADYRYTHEELSKIIAKARSTITEILSLTRLPETIKSECRTSNRYPRRLLVEIAKCKNEDGMVLLFEKVKKEALKSSQLRPLTRKTPDSRKAAAVCAIIRKAKNLSRTFDTLSLDIASEEEKGQLHDELRKLERRLADILAIVGAPT